MIVSLCQLTLPSLLLRSGKTFDVIVERSVSGVRQYDILLQITPIAERSEAVVVNIFVNYHNIVERSETVVIQIMKIVDCHVTTNR
jgi:hypothetical protein